MTEEYDNVAEEAVENDGVEEVVEVEAVDPEDVETIAIAAPVAAAVATPAAGTEETAEAVPAAPVVKKVQPRLPKTAPKGKVAPGTYLKKKGTAIKKPGAGVVAKPSAVGGAKKPASVSGAKKPASVSGGKMPAGKPDPKVSAPAEKPVKSGKCWWASMLVFWVFLLTAVAAAVLAMTILGQGEILAPATALTEKIPLGDTAGLAEAQATADQAAASVKQLQGSLRDAQDFLGIAPVAAEPEPVVEAVDDADASSNEAMLDAMDEEAVDVEVEDDATTAMDE